MKKTYSVEVQSTDNRGRVRIGPVDLADGAPSPDADVSLTLRFEDTKHGLAPGQKFALTLEG